MPEFAREHFIWDETGRPVLASDDESTETPGLFVVGPSLRHDATAGSGNTVACSPIAIPTAHGHHAAWHRPPRHRCLAHSQTGPFAGAVYTLARWQDVGTFN